MTRASIPVDLYPHWVVPTPAVRRGPNGTFVYVINDDNTTKMRAITVQKQDETQTVVSKGLDAAERIVTTGFARLTDGAKVAISSGDGTQAPAANRQRGTRPPGEKGERRKGGGDGASAPLQGAAPGTTPSAPPATPQ